MFGFIKRILGGERPPAAASGGPGSQGLAPPAAVPQAAPAPTAPPVVLQRDEMIDARTRIAGYRFGVRRPDGDGIPDAATVLDTLSANHVATFAERRLALISLRPEDWHAHYFRPLIGPHTVFLLQLSATPGHGSDWRETAALMRSAGARVALPVAGLGGEPHVAAEACDFLLLDFPAYTLANFERAVEGLAATCPRLGLIADNVGRWPEFRYCTAHGVSYCLGPFTTGQDEEQQSGEIGQSRLVLIEMLNLLRQEADLSDIAQVAKRDPGVVVKLVGMANSPMLGLTQAVTSIDQAIMVLGREQLYRWLSIAMFRSGAASPRDEVLLELALARGRFLEALGQDRHDKAACDELFLLGLLSLLDALLGVPMHTVVEKIHLSPALRDVLLSSDGPLGRYLMLAIAVEKGQAAQVAHLAEQLGFSLGAIEAASVEAIAWAEEAAQVGG